MAGTIKNQSAEDSMEAAVGAMQKTGVNIKKTDIDITDSEQLRKHLSRPITVKSVSHLHQQHALYDGRQLKVQESTSPKT